MTTFHTKIFQLGEKSIWDSVAAEASEIEEEHKSILDKPIEAHQDNPHDVVSWEEIKKNAKKSM